MVRFVSDQSPCCNTPLARRVHTSKVEVRKCVSCGTYWCEHKQVATGPDAWRSATVTPRFLEALRYRREVQARLIVDRFKDVLDQGAVLDYGCGQGVFVSHLIGLGVDAFGADLSVVSGSGESGSVMKDRFIALTKPWEIPSGREFKTVLLLDVLEHAADPRALILSFKARGVRRFIVKIPLADGPGFVASLGLGRLGAADLLEKLFLAGDIAPHLSYFSRRGLVKLFAAEGYRLKRAMKMTEVGRELSGRVRGRYPLGPTLGPRVFGALGWAAESVSKVWADTGVFLFEL